MGISQKSKFAALKWTSQEQYRIVSLPKLEDPIEAVIKKLTGEAQIKMLTKNFGSLANYIDVLKGIDDNKAVVQAVMPFVVEIE